MSNQVAVRVMADGSEVTLPATTPAIADPRNSPELMATFELFVKSTDGRAIFGEFWDPGFLRPLSDFKREELALVCVYGDPAGSLATVPGTWSIVQIM